MLYYYLPVFVYGNLIADKVGKRIFEYMEDKEQLNEKTTDWIEKEIKRLDSVRDELNRASILMRQETVKLKKEKEAFETQKQEFQTEMKDWLRQIEEKKEKLRQEEAFFDKKFKILEMGFATLDADKKEFLAQKRAFEFRRKYEQDAQMEESDFDVIQVASQTYFFRGVTHHLALKKRYKELIKIFHPDNLDGDKSALQQINKEYEQMKRALAFPKKA